MQFIHDLEEVMVFLHYLDKISMFKLLKKTDASQIMKKIEN